MSILWSMLGRAAYWLGWPASWLYLRDSQRTRLLLVCDSEVLVVHNWLSPDDWSMPGGGMHSGEEPAAGLVRELREETGIVLQTSDVRLLATEPFARHGFQYTNHYFVTEVSEKPLVGKLPFEITATAWKPLAEVRTGRGYGAEVLRALRLLDSQP